MSTNRAPDAYEITVCYRCDSSGKDKTSGRCRGCAGKGFVYVEKPASVCRFCLGTGDESYNQLCTICGGSGVAKTWRG